MKAKRKPKLAVWKFASCDGCQLSLLDCEDELLAVAGEVEIACTSMPILSMSFRRCSMEVSFA